MCKRQLTNVPQPLKNCRIDDFHFGFIEINETVDRISYFLHLHSANQTSGIRFLAGGTLNRKCTAVRSPISRASIQLVRANINSPQYIAYILSMTTIFILRATVEFMSVWPYGLEQISDAFLRQRSPSVLSKQYQKTG